ncbi:hypothetical protein MKEN_01475900 [Mycena kentingensis (nom. inval.)]|nr:hypothetical protein MKEN_01475900 [Mycena kentingensis (nom. inval.)]
MKLSDRIGQLEEKLNCTIADVYTAIAKLDPQSVNSRCFAEIEALVKASNLSEANSRFLFGLVTALTERVDTLTTTVGTMEARAVAAEATAHEAMTLARNAFIMASSFDQQAGSVNANGKRARTDDATPPAIPQPPASGSTFTPLGNAATSTTLMQPQLLQQQQQQPLQQQPPPPPPMQQQQPPPMQQPPMQQLQAPLSMQQPGALQLQQQTPTQWQPTAPPPSYLSTVGAFPGGAVPTMMGSAPAGPSTIPTMAPRPKVDVYVGPGHWPAGDPNDAEWRREVSAIVLRLIPRDAMKGSLFTCSMEASHPQHLVLRFNSIKDADKFVGVWNTSPTRIAQYSGVTAGRAAGNA